MLLPHPAVEVEHGDSKSMNRELTLSVNPKKPRGFFPHMESLPFEKPGAGVDLTFIARFILIPGAVSWSQPLDNLLRWVN